MEKVNRFIKKILDKCDRVPVKVKKAISFLLTAVCLAIFFCNIYRIICPSNIQVSGHSMEPTLKNGQKTEVLTGNGYTGEYTRGDIIAMWSKVPVFSKIYIKRIVAVPGDTVQIKNGAVYINEEKENAAFYGMLSIPATTMADNASELIVLKENEYYVLGDNRNHSNDSRNFGPVKREQIIGKIIINTERED